MATPPGIAIAGGKVGGRNPYHVRVFPEGIMSFQLDSTPEAAPETEAASPVQKKEGGAGLGSAARGSFESFSSGGGAALPAGVSEQLGAAYGADMSGVRVHDDASSHSAAASMDASAFTYGKDIYFGAGQYQPGTADGDHVLAHEAAHVAQQDGQVHRHLADDAAQGKAELGAESDSAETEASAAADAVASGGSFSVSRGPAKIRRFSATGHARHTERALSHMGLSAQEDRYGVSEVRSARSGNWERDLSQCVLPATRDLGVLDPIMHVLNILSLKDFGRPINLAEFGGYDPVEHMDNPADLRASGAFAQGGSVEGNLDADQEQQETVNGIPAADEATDEARDRTGWAGQLPDGTDVDPRYRATHDRLDGPGGPGMAMEDPSSIAFSVDNTGIPVYMSTSKQMLKEQLHNCIRLGRRGNDGRGPRLFSSAVHIMQDYYAHSNFSEIAINILLREGAVEIADEHGHIQEYSTASFGGRVLNTHLHGMGGPDGETVQDSNLTIGPDGRRREVMTTGSFNLIDTAASVLEEVKDKWMEVNPFQQNNKEASKFMGACLDYLQLSHGGRVNALGGRAASIFNGVIQWMAGLAPTAARVAEFGGDVAGGVARGAGVAASAGLGFLNWANAQLGGDADYWSREQRQVEGATSNAANNVEAGGRELADGIRTIGDNLRQVSAGFDGQHGLRNAYMWISENVTPIEWIALAAERIPGLGPEAARQIRQAGNDFKAYLEAELGSWWNDVITDGVAKINKAIQLVRARTNMRNQRHGGERDQTAGPEWLPDGARSWLGGARGKLQRTFGAAGDMYQTTPDGRRVPRQGTGAAPTLYNPPSHTEIAKDHGDISQGARDGHADGHGEPASRQEREENEDRHEHGAPPENAADDHDYEGRHGGHDHSSGDDHHGHVHLGAWLSPIAEGMSAASTRALGDVVSVGWDQLSAAADTDSDPDTTAANPNPAPSYPNRNAPGMSDKDREIDAVVETWFSHPEDCRHTWEGFIRSQLRGQRMGRELLRRLAEDLSNQRPSSPQRPEDMSEAAQLADGQRTDSIGPQQRRQPDANAPADVYDDAATRDFYGDQSRTAEGHRHDLRGGHAHGPAPHAHGPGHGHACGEHGQDDHVCAPGCDSHPAHGNGAHVCTDVCGEHAPHGSDAHTCGPGCEDQAAHGDSAHSCGPGCGDYAPHGFDAHQCTEYCERQAA